MNFLKSHLCLLGFNDPILKALQNKDHLIEGKIFFINKNTLLNLFLLHPINIKLQINDTYHKKS